MFLEHKVEVELFNMAEDDKVKVKVEAIDEIVAEEEEEDNQVLDLIESASDDEVDDVDVESAAEETDDQNAATTQRSG